MTVVDVVILFVILLSAIFGILRGFVKEATSLAKWIIATWIAATFAPKLSPMLPAALESEPVRQAVAFATLFLLVFLIGSLITHFVVTMVKKTGLSSLDRVLGAGFGVLRGVLIMLIFVIVAGHFPQLPQQIWWKQSIALERFENLAIWIQDYVPNMDLSFDRGVI